jgi:hypothetical protein
MEIFQLPWSRRYCPANIPKLNCKSKSKLCYDRRSASQSVLEQSTHFGLTTRSWLLSDSCGFVDLVRPLWREDGSVVCNCYWSSPAQPYFTVSTQVWKLLNCSANYFEITPRRGPRRKHSPSRRSFDGVKAAGDWNQSFTSIKNTWM